MAFSGGRDSVALLHCVASQARILNADGADLRVLALHVHHGLSAQADAWLEQCELQCRQWAEQGLPLSFDSRRLDGRPGPAQSIEAWAREQRYRALAEMASQGGAELLLLAHHRRDQAETLLLQSLRGAGVAGLAGMPARQHRGGLCWARPWLRQPREALETYVRAHGLSHVEDDSNEDPRYSRNRLRLQVWPALAQAFPSAEASLAQAAQWAQQALALQKEVAEQDLPSLLSVDGLAVSSLSVSGLCALSPARASNALRAWLHRQTGQAAPASLIQRLLFEMAQGGSRGRSWPCGKGSLRLYRDRLSWHAPALQPGLEAAQARTLDLSQPGRYAQADWAGAWLVEPAAAGGVAPALLSSLLMRARQGAEQFQRQPGTPARCLKKAYQSAAIPAWRRDGPLLLREGVLLFAPGLGLDARHLAGAGEPQMHVRWLRAGESETGPDS